MSRTSGIRGKGNHGSILRIRCRYYLKGTCTRSNCEYWHPPECQFNESETGEKAGDKCLFPNHKVDEQPNNKPKNSYFPRRESDDKNAAATAKSVSQLGCVSQDSDALVSQGTTEFRGNPMQKVLAPIQKDTIHKVYATSSEYPGKERTIVGRTNVKVPLQRSPYAMKFEDRSLKDNSDVPETRLSNLAKKH